MPVMRRLPVHDRVTLAEFQDGEERLVYARFKARPTDPPYYLEDGTAREVRAWAKEHLECFMPECEARALTTVARSAARDGFMHGRGAGGHSREGLFHQQAKALIERWVRDRYPNIGVVAEQATEGRERRADVMLTWPDGHQIAVEVQYAALTVDEWTQRDQSYRRAGITPLWLLGHIPPHFRGRAARSSASNQTAADDVSTVMESSGDDMAAPVKAEDIDRGDDVSLTVLHRAMITAGCQPLWLNPIAAAIGTAWSVTEHRTNYQRDVTREDAHLLSASRRPLHQRRRRRRSAPTACSTAT